MSVSIQIKEIQIGDVITSLLKGVGLLSSISSAEVLAIRSGNNLNNPTAAAINHTNIYGYLNPGLVQDDFTSYNYIEIKNQDGSVVEIGLPWIQEGTLTRAERATMRAIFTDWDDTKRDEFVDLMRIRGYWPVQIDIL